MPIDKYWPSHCSITTSSLSITTKTGAASHLRDQILERIPRRVLVRVQVRLEQVIRHSEIGVVEVVGNIEAQRPEFTALEEDRVEVGERKEKLLVLSGRFALGVRLFGDRVVEA